MAKCHSEQRESSADRNDIPDTCMISEFSKPYPDRNLMEWMASLQSERLFLPSV
ncbi:MAG: hypothetical protein HQM10_12550 [Candidatus Riflebacteria bacterium]|nr:hypothetical protein [Candidatus Riflebacteria bacterium]